MRAYQVETFKTIEGIRLTAREIPQPGPRQVLVAVKAASIARRDLYILNQTYPLPGRQGIIPLSDGAGEVVAIGREVTRFHIGDRVSGNYFPYWRSGSTGTDILDQLGCTVDGMLTEYALLEEASLVHIPEHLSWQEAATLPCAGLTAWSAIHGPQPLMPGSTLLTIGSGGVSVFGIQFAKMAGARVIALTSRDAKIDQLKALGADHVINYRANEHWQEEVYAVTGGRGADLVMETGGTDTLEQSVMATAFGGEITLLTPSGTITPGKATGLNKILTTLFVKKITLRPSFVGSRVEFEQMNRAISQHGMKPLIDKVFSFEQALDAYRYLAQGEQMGKIVIDVAAGK